MGDIPLDFGGELAKLGAFVGSHAVVVFSDHDDVKDAVVNLLKFFRHESCGQCTPCREGTDKMVTLLEGQGRIERAGAARPRNGHARLVDLRPRPGGAESGEPSADAVPEGLCEMTRSNRFQARRQRRSPRAPGETIWDVAKREGTKIPHLCHVDLPGYRVDGNCRACMVEVKGERVLDGVLHPQADRRHGGARRKPSAPRSRARWCSSCSRATCGRASEGPDNQAPFWQWAASMGIAGSDRYASKFDGGHEHGRSLDLSNPAIAVNLDACISCGACVRACREVQVNDVIGMGLRGSHAVPVFDIHDPMGLSTCVTCGECVQACPTGALYEKSLMDKTATTRAVQKFDKVVDTLCPFCGVGCQTSVAVKDNRIVQVDGRNGYANENRLCVKGRFGFDYVDVARAADEAADPPRRRAEVRRTAEHARTSIRSASSAKPPGKRR